MVIAAKFSQSQFPKTVKMHECNHLISYASRKDGFDNNAGGLSSHNTKAKTSAIVDQLDCLHVLPLGARKEKEQQS